MREHLDTEGVAGCRTLRFYRLSKEANRLSEFGSPNRSESPKLERDYQEIRWDELLNCQLRGGSLILEPSYRCNLRCRFCCLPVQSAVGLDWPRMRSVVRTLALSGMRDVVVTGGEPGLSELLPEILSELRYLRFRVTMLTNACWAADTEKCHEVAKNGIDTVLLAVKAFDDDAAHQLVDAKIASIQFDGYCNLVNECRKGVINAVTLMHVLTKGTMQSAFHLADWLADAPSPTRLNLTLMEPYSEVAVGMVPSMLELRESLPDLLRVWSSLGVPLEVEGFPLCLLGEHCQSSRDPARVLDQAARVWIWPREDGDHVCYYTGYQRHRQFQHVPVCDACDAKCRCPGLHARLNTPENRAGLAPLSGGNTCR